VTPYYESDGITLYHGDCLEIDAWLTGDVLVTDPPYGIGYTQFAYNYGKDKKGIVGDQTTEARDRALHVWGPQRPAVVFGDPRHPVPGAKTTLAYVKPPDSGIFGAVAGFRRDWEAVYLLGKFPTQPATRSGVLKTRLRSIRIRFDHPHMKPLDVMEALIEAMPPGTVVDPFAGSGATLLAARNQGRPAIGVEIEEAYCELIAGRLAQGVLL
jgi:DNA modification methylase